MTSSTPSLFGLSEDEQVAAIYEKAAQNIEAHRKRDATLGFATRNGEAIAGADVAIVQQSQDFLFGNLIFPLVGVLPQYDQIDTFRPALFKERFKEVFNMAIFPFYWSSFERTPGQPKWQGMPAALEWCKANSITPKGHPLAWVETGGNPKWLYDLPTDETYDLLQAHIKRTVLGFSGDIDLWDVVNEPTHTVSWSTMIKTPDMMRYTDIPISEIADWVEPCFRTAHEANPNAELVINDYEQIVSTFIGNTRERFFELAAELLHRGVPLHGLGIQAHEPVNEWYAPQVYWETLEYYTQLGLGIHITEFIPQSSGEEITGYKTGTWTLEAQSEFAEQLYRLSFGHPSVKCVNWWGLSDRYIWSERPGGGLLDEDYHPKPVYTMLKSLLRKEWMTKTSGHTDQNGTLRFRGFLGEYQLTLKTTEGKVHTIKVHLDGNEANDWKFTL